MDRSAWTVVIPVLFLFFPPQLAWGQTRVPLSTVSGCLMTPLARLRDNARCRASFLLRSSEGQRFQICFEAGTWEELLKEKSVPSCAEFSGRWKSESPLRNFEDDPPKNPEPTFFVQGVRAARPSMLASVRSKLELLRARLSSRLEPHDPWGIYRALILSESPGPSSPDPRLLRLLGFVHLLSVSGLHFYVLARIWNSILLNLFRSLKWPIRTGLIASRSMTGIQILFSWILCGLRLGMLRPWLVLALRGAAETFGFRWRKWTPLLATLLIEAANAAWATRSGESWISKLEGGLLYSLAVGGGLAAAGSGIGSHLRLALGAWIFSALWEIWHEGITSTLTPVLSLATIPFISFVLYPLLIASALGLLFKIPLHALEFLLSPVLDLGQRIFQTIASIAVRLPDLWVISHATLLSAIFVVLAYQIFIHERTRVRAALLAAGALALGCWSVVDATGESHPQKAIRVEQLDVGQGDAALVLSDSRHAGLIDTGSALSLSDSAWMKLLGSRGITRLDWILLTHLDQDHSGGLERLARLVPIGCATVSEGELSSRRGQAYAFRLARHGIRIAASDRDCVPYRVYFPPPEPAHSGKRNSNMSAVLIPLRAGGYYLSAGDADSSDEKRIGKWASIAGAEFGTPRILKISHHGSKSSSDEEFLNSIQPTEAWISVGNGNLYGHPSIQVLKKLSGRGIPLHRTDQEGFLSVGSVK